MLILSVLCLSKLFIRMNPMTNPKSNTNSLVAVVIVIGVIVAISVGGYLWLSNKNLAPSVGPDPRKEASK